MKARFLNSINTKLSDKTIEIIGITLICIFYFIGLLSYITVPIKPIYRLFISSSVVSIVIRGFLTFLILLFSIIVVIKYKTKIKWIWVILFAFIIFMTFISILISPRIYEYMYSGALYHEINVVRLDPGIPRTVAMFLSSIADFVFAFCIFFIIPIVIKDKKKLLFLLLPIVLIGLLECCYSLIKEKDLYIYLFSHPDDPFGGYGHEAGATFGNKEDWGAFLTEAFVSAVVAFIIVSNNKKGIAIKVGLIFSAIIFIIFAVLSLCKTSILAIGLCSIFCFAAIIYKGYKKSITIGVVLSGIVGCLLFFVILVVSTNGFGVPILSKISNFLNKLVISRAENALNGRSSLWLNYMQNVRGYNLFFGMGKSYVTPYTSSLIKEGQAGIHNGFAYFFASYGLAGFVLLCALILIALTRIIRLFSFEKPLSIVILGVFAAGITFVLAEAEVLIVSTSNPVFIYNVLVIMLPYGLILEKERKQKGTF